MDRLARFRSQGGFTLIEVLATSLILLVGIGAVVASFGVGNATTVTTRSRDVGTNLAREIIEASRGISYNELSDATFVSQLTSRNPRLADPDGAPYSVTRRGISYTVTHRVCVVDDGRDGGGNQSGGNFCPDSTPAGTIDRAPEDYKRVSVTVAWTVRGRTRSATQTTLINNPGSASAPAILSLTSPTLGSPPRQVQEGESSVNFAVTTSNAPHVVKWLLDGASQSPLVCSSGCAGSKGPFAFTWNLSGVADGPYLIGAEAFDMYSVSGPSRSMTVVVNRSLPKAPTGFAGGFNSQGVEMEWLPNSERDLRGYKVFRVDVNNTSLVLSMVCDNTTTVKTSCVDTQQNPPTAPAVAYRVFAYDSGYDGVTLREGGSSLITVTAGNTPPNKPVGPFELLKNADGTTKLRWRRAEPPDPNGDKLAFYRIYRDGTTIPNNRYGRVAASGDQLEFLDAATGGTTHTYYVTAVDERYGESAMLGPVTG